MRIFPKFHAFPAMPRQWPIGVFARKAGRHWCDGWPRAADFAASRISAGAKRFSACGRMLLNRLIGRSAASAGRLGAPAGAVPTTLAATGVWLAAGIWASIAVISRPHAEHLALYGAVTSFYVLGLWVLAARWHRIFSSFRAGFRDLQGEIQKLRRENEAMRLDLEGFRSLFKVTASMSAQMDISVLLRMIAREAVTTLRAHQSSLMLLDRERKYLRTVATCGTEDEEIVNARVRVGDAVAGWVAQHGKPRLLQGRLKGTEFRNLVSRDRGIVSAVSVPLRLNKQTIGVLNVNLLDTRRQFNDDELRLLMIYANHAAVAIRNASLLSETREKTRLQSVLDGYVSPQVARVLVRSPGEWMKVGDMRELTVLFADIRGFTRGVHRMGPLKTRLFLNQVFTRLSEILADHSGSLNKFIGDSIMAFFDAPGNARGSALRAVRAATGMVEAFEAIRLRWAGRSPDVADLSLGVGISTGKLFLGTVGSDRRFDYTLVGREVNVAKRLSDMAEGGQIILSEHTRGLLPPEIRVRHLGDVRFKGLDHPVHLFGVVKEAALHHEGACTAIRSSLS